MTRTCAGTTAEYHLCPDQSTLDAEGTYRMFSSASLFAPPFASPPRPFFCFPKVSSSPAHVDLHPLCLSFYYYFYFFAGATLNVDCASGMYSSTCFDSCVDSECKKDTLFQPAEVTDGRQWCRKCAQGKFLQNQRCEACPTGFSTSSLTAQTKCDACGSSGNEIKMCVGGGAVPSSGKCPAGSYSQTCQQSLASCDETNECAACPSGWSLAAGTDACQQCDAGQFASLPSQTECTSCDAGKYSDEIGNNDASSCVECNAGSFSVAGSAQCSACEVGYHASDIGTAGSCVACPLGKYGESISATACSTCRGGRYVDRLKYCLLLTWVLFVLLFVHV